MSNERLFESQDAALLQMGPEDLFQHAHIDAGILRGRAKGLTRLQASYEVLCLSFVAP
jgi:hypothetical protein